MLAVAYTRGTQLPFARALFNAVPKLSPFVGMESPCPLCRPRKLADERAVERRLRAFCRPIGQPFVGGF